MTAREIAAAVRSGERSAVEVVEEHLARIDARDAELHAFNLVLAEQAREAAAAVDAKVAAGDDPGPLAGVPVALKALLLAIAVIDDIGAIAIIAVFYTGNIDLGMLAAGAIVLVLLGLTGRLRVASSIPYVLLSILMWAFILKSASTQRWRAWLRLCAFR